MHCTHWCGGGRVGGNVHGYQVKELRGLGVMGAEDVSKESKRSLNRLRSLLLPMSTGDPQKALG